MQFRLLSFVPSRFLKGYREVGVVDDLCAVGLEDLTFRLVGRAVEAGYVQFLWGPKQRILVDVEQTMEQIVGELLLSLSQHRTWLVCDGLFLNPGVLHLTHYVALHFVLIIATDNCLFT